MKLDEFCEMLLAGEDGAVVFRLMRASIKSICALRVAVSRVRDMALTTDDPRRFHPRHRRSISKMKKVAAKEAAPDPLFDAFLSFSLKEKAAAKRKLRSEGAFFASANLDAMLRDLPILPENFDSFKLSKKLAKRCAEVAKHNLQVKNENVKIVQDGAAVLAEAVEYSNLAAARIGSVKISVPRLAACLRRKKGL